MNVVYASNDGYARHLAVSMISLFDRNLMMKEIVVYIISMGISEESKGRLRSIAAQYGREICFLEVADIESLFDYDVDTRGFDISAMGRIFVGSLLPEEVDRVLYLDCDTVVVQSLMELWRTNLYGKVLGAVMEPTIYEAVKQDIGLSAQDFYVNSGVLLIDLAKWRRSNVERRLLKFYKEKNGSLFACDQDTINGSLKGEIRPLPPKYNFFPNYRYFSYKDLVRHSPAYEKVTAREFRIAKSHPTIIHYAGDERPWISGNQNHYRKAYEKYLSMTPWAGTPKEKGKEWYMLAYHLMDYVTWLCPEIRWFISRKLGMKVVEARKHGK